MTDAPVKISHGYTMETGQLRDFGRRERVAEDREVVDPSLHEGSDQVFFGVTLAYADGAGRENRVTILGLDEAVTSQGQISWISPVARALIKAREGDVVRLVLPDGSQELEVLSVTYPSARLD